VAKIIAGCKHCIHKGCGGKGDGNRKVKFNVVCECRVINTDGYTGMTNI
jgi:hypothetical protein